MKTAVLLGFFWAMGLLLFMRAIPDAPAVDESATDAIVVLTGGSKRLDYGIELMARGRAKKLFISGVGKGVQIHELLRASKFPRFMSYLPKRDEIIVLGYDASDTKGNARETARWMKKQGFTSLRLVTASYHMPRSLLEFQQVMPDYRIVPDAVFPEHFRREEWWRFPGTAQLMLSEYHKYLASLGHHLLNRLLEHLPENEKSGAVL